MTDTFGPARQNDLGRQKQPAYYDCGICGHFHNVNWNGDCREDDARLTFDDLDTLHGENQWDFISWGEMCERDK